MSAAAADLLAYIDGSIAETAGTDLFEGGFTEQPDNQVLVRNTAMATANTKAQAIYALLDNLQEYTGGSGAKYFLVQAIAGEPHLMGVDDNHRWVYEAHYEAQKARG